MHSGLEKAQVLLVFCLWRAAHHYHLFCISVWRDWIRFSVAQCATCAICNSIYLPCVLCLDLDDSFAIAHCVVICVLVYPHNFIQALLILCSKWQIVIRNTGICNNLPHVPFLILLAYFHVMIITSVFSALLGLDTDWAHVLVHCITIISKSVKKKHTLVNAVQQPEALNLSDSSWNSRRAEFYKVILFFSDSTCFVQECWVGVMLLLSLIVLTAFKQILSLEKILIMWSEVSKSRGFSASDWRFQCV